MEMRNIALLGSTGSIGTNTLEVIARNRDRFRLVGLAAGESKELIEEQVREFAPEIVSVKNKEDAEALKAKFPGLKVYYSGEGLLETVSHPAVDTMVSAIDGTTALEATLLSIRNNHRICLANKETLVAAGELINRELARSRAEIIPIDSEQSAIFQAIGHNSKDAVKRIILTASGGPFFKEKKENFKRITVKQALAHPTWSMGAKVTIDSATLMNKALEVIEAFYLFRLNPEQIEVIIHPQSIIHSMVEYIDTSILAQLSLPDMRLPILYSLSYPERVPFETETLNFSELRKLEFFDVDRETFPSIRMAYDVLKTGKSSGAVFNAANETAVDYFLKGNILFSDIFAVVEEMFYNETFRSVETIEEINEIIRHTKEKTAGVIERRFGNENNM